MAKEQSKWKRIAKGEKLPCDSLLMKKDGTIISVVTGGGVKVGQDAYYPPIEELKSFPKEESDDERIRKTLVAVVNLYYGEGEDKEKTACLAWLEKQGEQKPADKVESKFKVGDIVKHKDNPHLTYILKRFTDDGDYEFHAIGKDGNEGCTHFAAVKCQDDWELVERSPAWSEDDEKKRKCLIKGLEDRMGFGWASDPFSREELINWLKSLRPKNTWKPSESDIFFLERIANGKYNPQYFQASLGGLIEQLKKLRKE